MNMNTFKEVVEEVKNILEKELKRRESYKERGETWLLITEYILSLTRLLEKLKNPKPDKHLYYFCDEANGDCMVHSNFCWCKCKAFPSRRLNDMMYEWRELPEGD